MFIQQARLLIALLALLITPKGFSYVEIGNDLGIAGSYAGTNIRSYTHILIGPQVFGVGAFALIDQASDYNQDLLAGGALGTQISNWIVEVGGGIFTRKYKYEGVHSSSRGVGGILVVGYAVSKWMRISFPIIYRKASNPDLNLKQKIDAVPMIGGTIAL